MTRRLLVHVRRLGATVSFRTNPCGRLPLLPTPTPFPFPPQPRFPAESVSHEAIARCTRHHKRQTKLFVPNSPYGLSGRKAALNERLS